MAQRDMGVISINNNEYYKYCNSAVSNKNDNIKR